jgi:hypothetical protein
MLKTNILKCPYIAPQCGLATPFPKNKTRCYFAEDAPWVNYLEPKQAMWARWAVNQPEVLSSA